MTISELYWKIKRWNHHRRITRKRRIQRRKVLKYIAEKVAADERSALQVFFGQREFYMVPYLWAQDEYKPENVQVFYDVECGLHYVNWHGKRLYWRRNTSESCIKESVNALLIEQDNRSPHHYVIDQRLDGAVVADIGSAEGCFGLDVVDRVKHLYLFECDDGWIEALQQTFRPWGGRQGYCC